MMRYIWQDWFGLRGSIEQAIPIFLLRVVGVVVVIFVLNICVDVLRWLLLRGITVLVCRREKRMLDLSVIVPVYNVEDYLDGCMESLIGQTYEDFEIIVINDGSTDGSAVLCNKWAERDKRVRVFHQENKGLSAVRNRGLELAQGEYITWVDSDDYVDTFYLEKLLKAYESTGADMVMCSFYTDTDGLVEHRGKDLFPAEEIDRQTFLERLYVQGMYSVVWNKFLPRDAYGEIQFPAGRVFEDSSVMCQLTRNCKKITVIEEPPKKG